MQVYDAAVAWDQDSLLVESDLLSKSLANTAESCHPPSLGLLTVVDIESCNSELDLAPLLM